MRIKLTSCRLFNIGLSCKGYLNLPTWIFLLALDMILERFGAFDELPHNIRLLSKLDFEMDLR